MLEYEPRPTGRLRVAGWAGIFGGLLWAALTMLRREIADGGAVIGLSRQEVGLVTPIVAALLLLALNGVHRLHAGRAGRWERIGFWITNAGLLLLTFGLVVDRWLIGEQPDGGFIVAYFGASSLVTIGMILWGVGTLRARVLPGWARALPLVLGPAFLAESFVRFAPFVGPIEAVAWVGLGVGVLSTPIAETPASKQSLTLREARAAFLSRVTLISGVIAVAAWSLEWSWIVGVLVVLLLYAHEIGHVLAAFWRGVQIKKAPVFLPGFGAFVETAPGASAWDDAWISLGGPVFGAACALAAKLLGIRLGSPELAHAGDFALLINLLNLAPFSPLDGGRVARTTGWLGALLTIGLGVFLLFQDVGLFLSAVIILAGVQAIATVRQNQSGLVTHAGIFGVYLASMLVLFLARGLGGPVEWLPSSRPSWLPSLSTLFEVVFWVWVAGIFALPFAWRPGQTPLVRYGIAALVGWPRYLLDRKLWMIPVSFALLGEAVGMPGVGWTRRYAVRLAGKGDPAGGAAAAYAFDTLIGKGDPGADAWLDELWPPLALGGDPVTAALGRTLAELGYTTTASTHGGIPDLERAAADHGATEANPPYEPDGRAQPARRPSTLPSNVSDFR